MEPFEMLEMGQVIKEMDKISGYFLMWPCYFYCDLLTFKSDFLLLIVTR